MMSTRCPSCQTAFRVTPEQLKVRAGQVRCGHCNVVFNALESLEDAFPAAKAATAPIAPSNPARPVDTAPQPEGPLEEPAEARAENPEKSAAESPAPANAPRGVRVRVFTWTAAVLLMLIPMALQVAYVFRAELAVDHPGLRPMLDEMCAALDCDIPLPRKADLVSIEASDLHPDPKQGKLLVLTATLKNRAAFAQAYPWLELTLTDTRDQPLVRRALAPKDYLTEGTDGRTGFAANSELVVTLWLDAASVAATGYRIYLFYP
jgi:predicted Zn finger-like uncharacterized protein